MVDVGQQQDRDARRSGRNPKERTEQLEHQQPDEDIEEQAEQPAGDEIGAVDEHKIPGCRELASHQCRNDDRARDEVKIAPTPERKERTEPRIDISDDRDHGEESKEKSENVAIMKPSSPTSFLLGSILARFAWE